MAAINITVEIFALAVTLLLLLCGSLDKNKKDRMSLMANMILLCNAALLVACIVTWVLEGNSRYETLNTVITAFANGLGFPMAACYTEYVACSIGEHTTAPGRFALTIEAICILAFILNFVSIFNGMYFTCPGGVYTRGPLFLINQMFSAVVLLPNAYVILRHYRLLGVRETVSLLSFAVLPLLVALTQFAFSGITTMCLSTTLTCVIIYVSVYLRRGWRLMEQEQELTESRISVMLSQIQPHFLYNALTAIARLCDLDPGKAKKTTLDFSDYLRGNLDSISQKKPVPFATELKHSQIYTDIEQIRFGDKLHVIYNIKTEDFLIPSLTVQPLIENAVKHGVGKKKGGGTVQLSTMEETDGWRVIVADDGVGFDPVKTQEDGRSHIGIDNVRRRLFLQCNGILTIKSTPGSGTIAEIMIPKGEKRK